MEEIEFYTMKIRIYITAQKSYELKMEIYSDILGREKIWSIESNHRGVAAEQISYSGPQTPNQKWRGNIFLPADGVVLRGNADRRCFVLLCYSRMFGNCFD